GSSHDSPAPDAGADAAPDTGSASGCPAGHAGDACVIALYDAGCDKVADLTAELATHAQPLWANGRALFVTDKAVAGDFNNWQPTITPAPYCNTALSLAV